VKREIDMEDMIAFCGLICNGCGALLATKNDDNEKRAEVAQLWSQILKTELKSEDINCEGCRSEGGLLFSYCKVCEVRKCGMERGVMNCAYCNEYPCKKLDFIFGSAPESKKRLDEIRKRSQT
jgi:hypothetical protein